LLDPLQNNSLTQVLTKPDVYYLRIIISVLCGESMVGECMRIQNLNLTT